MPKSDFWEKMKQRLVEVSNAAADFTEEQAIVGKLKFDILNLKRRIDRDLHNIGSRVLDIGRSAAPSNPLEDGEVRNLIASIGDLERQVDRKRRQIGQVADQIRSRRRSETPAAGPAPTPAATPTPKPTPARKPAAKKTASPKPAVSKPPRKKEKPAEDA